MLDIILTVWPLMWRKDEKLQKALDLLEKSRKGAKRLQEVLKEQMEITRELKEAVAKQEETVHDMGKPTVEIKDQMAEEVQSVHEQLETIAANAKGGPQRSYSDVTRHHSYPTTIRGP
ncbi:hypothetical protein FOXG_14178 [Fusarium oxysporum f. sp. lycopersici 4287]|uniref:Uncharacterized protein n=3 Tax=Fusarium oxysporum TaxID=5507 RepID=A0A0J9VYC3_FUSO4|nr:hypothetical protein FOXG_14178 [Fusarium oxysporum f. sp. lycopersici 4287]KNB15793.1 hypothetical protein FOXG_14178 [Fusarium oxysporum f. sp. lycopersici 4287]